MATPEKIRRVGFFIRFLAGAIDWFLATLAATLFSVIWYGVWLLANRKPLTLSELFSMTQLSSEWIQWVDGVFEICILMGYFTFLHSRTGSTFGKKLFSLRVIYEKTGKTLSFQRSLARSLSYFLSVLPFGSGFLMVFFHPRKKALHDLVVGSQVVYFKKKA